MSVSAAAMACSTAADMVSTAATAAVTAATAATAGFNPSLGYILIQEGIILISHNRFSAADISIDLTSFFT